MSTSSAVKIDLLLTCWLWWWLSDWRLIFEMTFYYLQTLLIQHVILFSFFFLTNAFQHISDINILWEYSLISYYAMFYRYMFICLLIIKILCIWWNKKKSKISGRVNSFQHLDKFWNVRKKVDYERIKLLYDALRIIFLQNSKFLCGANSVSMELFQFTSTWLIVALTWTRAIAVMFPFGARDQTRSAITIITSLVCISFIISLTKLYSGGKAYIPYHLSPLWVNCVTIRLCVDCSLLVNECWLTLIVGYETDSVFEFVPCQKMKPWGSAMYFYIALSTWLPLLFISIGNLLLIVRMRRSYKIHNELTRKSSPRSLMHDVIVREDLTVTFASDNFRYRSNRTNNSSRTLFAVSIVHLILLLPLGIVETLELYWDVILIKHPSNAGENERYIHWYLLKIQKLTLKMFSILRYSQIISLAIFFYVINNIYLFI